MKILYKWPLPFTLLILADITLTLVVKLDIFNLYPSERAFWAGFIFALMFVFGVWSFITIVNGETPKSKSDD